WSTYIASTFQDRPLTYIFLLVAHFYSMRFVTFFVCNLLLLIWASSSLQPACGQTVQLSLGDRTKALPLVKGKPLKREFGPGDVHSYQISLNAGEYVGMVIKTVSGFDQLVTLTGPDKRQL